MTRAILVSLVMAIGRAQLGSFAQNYRAERSVLSFSYANVKDGRIVAAERTS